METLDLLLIGGRAIDPETGLDGTRNIGIRAGTIVHIGTDTPEATRTLDITGRVITPGFIDLHSHSQSINGLRIQACDGVTTSLELEAGAAPIAPVYAAAEAEGRPINFGYSVDWRKIRMSVLDGIDIDGEDALGERAASLGAGIEDPKWLELAESDALVDAVVARVEEEIRAGGIGIGAPVGYSPRSDRKEMLKLGRLAADLDVPLFVHGRFAQYAEPGSSVEGALELIGVAAGTGANVHLCHINSSYGRDIHLVADAVATAQAQGVRVTTEAYPYYAFSTAIGAPFLAPEELPRMPLKVESFFHLPTGEYLTSVEQLAELREKDPSGTVIVEFLDPRNPEEMALLYTAVTFPDAAIASDAMWLQIGDRRTGGDVETQWPLAPEVFAHPRTAGTFSRAIGHIGRELGLWSLGEAIRRCTLLPAQILEDCVPAMELKGRLQIGCDADLTVFDPDTILDAATFTEIKPSVGIDHVIVGGEFVLENGELLPEALPGKALRSEVV